MTPQRAADLTASQTALLSDLTGHRPGRVASLSLPTPLMRFTERAATMAAMRRMCHDTSFPKRHPARAGEAGVGKDVTRRQDKHRGLSVRHVRVAKNGNTERLLMLPVLLRRKAERSQLDCSLGISENLRQPA